MASQSHNLILVTKNQLGKVDRVAVGLGQRVFTLKEPMSIAIIDSKTNKQPLGIAMKRKGNNLLIELENNESIEVS